MRIFLYLSIRGISFSDPQYKIKISNKEQNIKLSRKCSSLDDGKAQFCISLESCKELKPENAAHRILKCLCEIFLPSSRSIPNFLFLEGNLRSGMQFHLSSFIFHTFHPHISYFLGESCRKIIEKNLVYCHLAKDKQQQTTKGVQLDRSITDRGLLHYFQISVGHTKYYCLVCKNFQEIYRSKFADIC